MSRSARESERGIERTSESESRRRAHFCCSLRKVEPRGSILRVIMPRECAVAAAVAAAAAAAARVLIDDCIHKCSVLLCVCSCLSALFHNSACCRWLFFHSECMFSVFQFVFVLT